MNKWWAKRIVRRWLSSDLVHGIGGQSLKGPINALQNAITFNYYGNSTFYNTGIYADATKMETLQYSPNDDPEIALPNDINIDINQSAINPDILLT